MAALALLFQRLPSAHLGRMWITSDTLYPVNVFTDLFVDKFSLGGWQFSIAPCWFPDLLLVGSAFFVTRDVILATILAGFLQFVLLVLGFQLCWRVLKLRNIVAADIATIGVAIAITIFVALQPDRSYPAFYKFFLPQTHVGHLLLIVYAFALAVLMAWPASRSRKTAVCITALYGALCFLSGMSNLLFVVHFLGPISCVLLFFALLRVLPLRDAGKPLLLGWIAALAGAVANKVLFHTTSALAQSVFGLAPMKLAAVTFYKGALGQLGRGEIQHVLALCWLLICTVATLVFLGHTLFSRSERGREAHGYLVTSFLLFAGIASVLSAAAVIIGCSNGLTVFKDYIWTMHYLHPMFFLPLFGWPVLLGTAAWANGRGVRLVLGAACLVVPVVMLARTARPAVPVHRYVPQFVQSLDAQAKQYGLKYGVAGYWQARIITLLSRTGLRVYQVNGSLNAFPWANNIEWYSQSVEDHARRPRFTFVVLGDPLWKISRDTVTGVFGEPAGEARLDSTSSVLLYPERAKSREPHPLLAPFERIDPSRR